MNTQKIVSAFIAAGLWASTDRDGTPLDGAKYSNFRWSKKEMEKVNKFVSDFIAQNEKVCEKAIEIYGEDSFGHDLFLNCAGHGVGYLSRNCLAVPSGEKTVLKNVWNVETKSYKERECNLSVGEYLDDLCEKNSLESFDAYRGWYYMSPV